MLAHVTDFMAASMVISRPVLPPAAWNRANSAHRRMADAALEATARATGNGSASNMSAPSMRGITISKA